MPQLSDQAQFRAYCVLQSWQQLDGDSHALLEGISQQWQVRALDFFCETKASAGGKSQQVVHLILATPADTQRLHGNRDAQAEIASRVLQFLQSATVQSAGIPILGEVFSMEVLQTTTLVVTFRPLKNFDETTLNDLWEQEKRALLATYETVWTISQAMVFFFTDAQVVEARDSGLSTKIIEELTALERKYYPKSNPVFYFDSKETFDRDFSSNWYYYWK